MVAEELGVRRCHPSWYIKLTITVAHANNHLIGGASVRSEVEAAKLMISWISLIGPHILAVGLFVFALVILPSEMLWVAVPVPILSRSIHSECIAATLRLPVL